MLTALIRFALNHRPLVIALSLVALVWGGYLTTTLPIDVFPDLDRPRVVVLVECPGLSPEEIESLVTQPIESVVVGAFGVEAVRSQSGQGLAVVYVEFGWAIDGRIARQMVSERLNAVSMPPGIVPQLAPSASLMGQFLQVGLTRRTGPRGGQLAICDRSEFVIERLRDEFIVWQPIDRRRMETWRPIESIPVRGQQEVDAAVFTHWGRTHRATFRSPLEDRMDLRTTADWIVRPRLIQIAGVAECMVVGGDVKQYQVLVDPNKLNEHRVSLQCVEEAVRQNNQNSSGGYIDDGLTERPVRVMGRLGPRPEDVVDDLARVPVSTRGERPIRLGQVADLRAGSAPKRGDAGINGRTGVLLTLVKQPHADTRRLTETVKEALRETENSLPADIEVNSDLFQLRDFIDRGLYYVGEALVIGAVLVMIILFLFLLNLRTTFITLTAIPLSLVVTTLVFRLIGAVTGTGLSINVMTLGGIAVAMGELVDDAIVDVENIFRRLRENNVSSSPRPALTVVYEASREVRSAIVFGTAVVILAFLPLFALSGVEGRLFVPLGVAYIVSILASLLISLTVTPVLSYYLLPRARATHARTDGLLLRGLKAAARPLIRFSMRRAGTLLLLTWLLVGGAVWQLSRLGTDFLPRFDEGSIQLNIALSGGSSLTASNEAAALIDEVLTQYRATAEHPERPVRHFSRRSGRAALDEHAEPVNRGEYILTMNPNSSYRREEFLRELLAELRRAVPHAEFETDQPLSHLISHLLSGVNAQISVKIFGDDLDKLQQLAQQIRAVLATVPGTTTPIVDPQERVDEIHVVLRPEELAQYGLSRQYVAEFVQTALKGETISQVMEGQRRFDLVVKLREPQRSDADRLRDLLLDLPENRGQIRLGEVADFPEAASGPNMVNRENVRRRQTVRCNVSGRDLGGTAADVEQRVRQAVDLPEGYFIEFGGLVESQRTATVRIGLLAIGSIAGIFVVLMMLYPSVRISLQILNAIPTAFIGGVTALALTGQTLTVASLVGFVSLGGIAVRNGILLVTHYFHLMKEEGEGFTESMVMRGSLERLAPVLMTALTAGIGLMPLVIGGRKPGLEILYPVATVILGGLITSTLCEFLIHPGLFRRFSGRDAMRLSQGDALDAIDP